MVQGKWFASGADLSVPLSLREKVFSLGRDGLDDWAQQVAVFDGDGVPAGTARLAWRDGAFDISLLGVTEERRGLGFGDLLVRLCLFKALTHSAREVTLTPTAETEGFFARYGFRREGAEMRLRAEDIVLSHCGGHCAACGQEGCADRK